MTIHKMSPEYRDLLTSAVFRAYSACPHANLVMICEEFPDSRPAWEVRRLEGRALLTPPMYDAELSVGCPTLGIIVPADLYAASDELGDEVMVLADEVRQEILSRAQMTAEDEAKFRAAARSVLEVTTGVQVFMVAPSELENPLFFSVLAIRAGEYGIVVPPVWICVPELIDRAHTILLEESSERDRPAYSLN